MRRSLLRGSLPHVTVRPRRAKPFTWLRGEFELCEYSESVIVVRLTADSMTFLRTIPYPAVALAEVYAKS